MANPLLDEIPLDDLVRLRRQADDLAAAHPGESERKRAILAAQAEIRDAGALDALLRLEQAYSARLVAAVDVAIAVGARYGRARGVVDLDEPEQSLLVEIAGLGLDLTHDQRLRALIAALRLEVG
jgi:hypothetical protein